MKLKNGSTTTTDVQSGAMTPDFVAEAANRGVRRIWVASYDFQAPGLYEKAGFTRVAEFAGWPEGHSNVVLCKTLIAG